MVWNADDPKLLIAFFDGIQELRRRGIILSYHDRSDGGLFATVCEMMFAGGTGVTLALDGLTNDPMAQLFSEELGAVVQIRTSDVTEFRQRFETAGLPTDCLRPIGQLRSDDVLVIERDGVELSRRTRFDLRRIWSETSFAMQSLRDEPRSAAEEYDLMQSATDPGITPLVTFDPEENVARSFLDSVIENLPGSRASEDGDFARARRQRSDRNGRRLRPSRIRSGGCPHERSAFRTGNLGRFPRPRGLRRVLLR
jgi:phosphoribosylformylglycinamidine synthase